MSEREPQQHRSFEDVEAVSLLGESGRQVAIDLAEISMRLKPVKEAPGFYYEGRTLALKVDEETMKALRNLTSFGPLVPPQTPIE